MPARSRDEGACAASSTGASARSAVTALPRANRPKHEGFTDNAPLGRPPVSARGRRPWFARRMDFLRRLRNTTACRSAASLQRRDQGRIVAGTSAQPSHIRVVGPAAAFGRHPDDVLIRILDVTGFAMHAILGVDDIFRGAAFLDPFVYARRAI